MGRISIARGGEPHHRPGREQHSSGKSFRHHSRCATASVDAVPLNHTRTDNDQFPNATYPNATSPNPAIAGIEVPLVTSLPKYPSPWGTGAGAWEDAYTKARAFVAQLTLTEMVNLTTGVG